jgi:hypothetical protein
MNQSKTLFETKDFEECLRIFIDGRNIFMDMKSQF